MNISDLGHASLALDVIPDNFCMFEVTKRSKSALVLPVVYGLPVLDLYAHLLKDVLLLFLVPRELLEHPEAQTARASEYGELPGPIPPHIRGVQGVEYP